jgi:Ca2+-transporting ATPase
MVGHAVLQGSIILAVCIGIFLTTRGAHGPEAARALVFACLVVAFLLTILLNRSTTRTAVAMFSEPNAAVWWVVAGACAFLTIVLTVPGVQTLFQFAPLHAPDVAVSVLAGAACLLWVDARKLLRRRTAPQSTAV